MKLTFLPTLTDLREMLGDRLYVDFVWMWREQEQGVRTRERRARWGEEIPACQTANWPQPMFARAEASAPAESAQKPAQVALLHPNIQRLLEQRAVNGDRLKSDPDSETETVASRARAVGLRAAE